MTVRTAKLLLFFTVLSVATAPGCWAQTEDEALNTIRQFTRTGKMPPEDLVANIEKRFAGKRTGALAKLLHGKMRFDAGDFAGAAAVLNSDVFSRTKLADYATWLRGKALEAAGDHLQAMSVLSRFEEQYPGSIRAKDAALTTASAAIAAGRAADVPRILSGLIEKDDPDALLLAAQAADAQNDASGAVKFYRRAYLVGPGTQAAQQAQAKLASTSQPLQPQTPDEQRARAEALFAAHQYGDATAAFADLASRSPGSMTTAIQMERLSAAASSGRSSEAQAAFAAIPAGAKEREEAYRQLVLAYAKARQWPQAHSTAEEMRQKYPHSSLTAKAWVDAGLAARDARNTTESAHFLNGAVASFPDAVEVAQAQFESAWMQHESKNYSISSQMLVQHLARYTDRDTTNRGKAGYWAARDSELAGKMADACVLYDAVDYRYGSNWYGYLALNRLTALKSQNVCSQSPALSPDVQKAAANLRKVIVAPETAGPRELERAAKGEELSTIGLFDWAADELQDAKRTANTSPAINLALAKSLQMKGDNVGALVALQKSYPDYAQMFPEEMGRDEWTIFYPLTNWTDIKTWAGRRGLDPYQVAGFIRQETIFDPKAHSHANAYGLMQLLLPTARTQAARNGASRMPNSPDDLYDPQLNIELGTGFLKDLFAKFGRVEYVAVAYNAGPGRVPQWRASLPAEMDEFVEAIPFKETKQYVQGIIRNTAQYRRLYDENGKFKPNVGTRPIRAALESMPQDQFTAKFPDVIVDDIGE